MTQVASDATSGAATAGGTVTTLSWSHTCSASATDLYVGMCVTSTSANGHSTSIAYNGVNLSSVTSGAMLGSGTTVCGEVWHLSNPTAGANTVSATFNTTVRPAATAYSVLGGSDTSAFGAPQVASAATSASPTVSGIPSVSASDLVLGFLFTRKGDTVTISGVGPNETLLSTITSGAAAATALQAVDSKAGNGSTTSVSYNLSATNTWVLIGVAALAAGGAPPAGPSGGGAYFYRRRHR